MIKDLYNRVHNYLRISLTDNCNLRCFYCMPEEEYSFTPAARLMQAHEVETLARIFVDNGVSKIRLTGGEPLVRKDAGEIIRSLSRLPVKLTMTTNGTRIHEFIDLLYEGGIRTLNVSLDTLHREKFLQMTRRDLFDRVMQNIRMLVDKGFHVKVNVVVTKGLNDNEIKDFIAWTKNEPLDIRFIEFMPFSGNKWSSDKVFTWQEILQLASEEFDIIPVKRENHDTSKRYRVPGHTGSFAVISTMSEPFCSDCNRMRLTADGKLKNCLFSKSETDLLSALRRGEAILPLIEENIRNKAKELGGQFTKDFEHLNAESINNRSMITIGG
jgi:GTP 3',8-cyclase